MRKGRRANHLQREGPLMNFSGPLDFSTNVSAGSGRGHPLTISFINRWILPAKMFFISALPTGSFKMLLHVI